MDAAKAHLKRALAVVNTVTVPLTRRLGLASFLAQVRQKAGRDHVSAFAGNLTYRGTFALFPFLLFLLSLLGIFGATNLVQTLLGQAATVMPPDALTLVRHQILPIAAGRAAGTITVGAIVALLAALWGIAGGFKALMDAMNVMYAVADSRPFWRRTVLATLLALAVVTLLLVALGLVVFGPEWAATLARPSPAVGPAFVLAWRIIQWPVLLSGVLFAFALVYSFAPDVQQRFRFISPGSVIALIGWLLFSFLFRLYVQRFGSYNKTYGTLAGFALLMLYIYWASYILLLGAEVNQVIEAHAPGGKQSGDRAPGQPADE